MSDETPTQDEGVVEVEHPVYGPIRRFLDSDLNASIDRAVATLPEGFPLVVEFGAKQGEEGLEVRLGVVWKIGDAWSFVGVLEKPFKGKLGGEVMARWRPDF